MKKKLAVVLCIFLALSGLCACASEQKITEGTVSVYFRLKEKTGEENFQDSEVIGCEYRITDEQSIVSAMDMLLWGPLDDNVFDDTFPANLRVLEIKQENSTVVVTLSEEYSKLQGVDMSIANACITKTLTQFDDVERVVVSYALPDGKSKAERFTADSFETVSQKQESQEYAVTIYYANDDGMSMLPYSENLVAAEPEKVERFILDAVINGTKGDRYQSAVPEGAQVLGIYTDNGTCYINLNSTFLETVPGSETSQIVAVYSIVNSLTAMDEVEDVQLLVEGKVCENYGEVPIGMPLDRDESVIYRKGNYLSTLIYLKRQDKAYMSPRFWQIERSEYATDEQLIVQTLLNMSIPQGYEQLFPKGTQLQTIATRDGVCYIDLTEELLNAGTREIVYAAYSLTASLVQLEEVNEVELTCGGRRIIVGEFELPLRFNKDNVMIG